ncbi:MAG: nickel pincer cofactor biosynthesis protein LarB [Dehalococcoidia bacterium]|nr:nickel pincer cofactor biosynthesis protein LarB [Dehalococcoidia bacterium]MDP6226982.1 nickel pincer cofactor biosynthesis protein LarB [Dehalococcoidia bacterium]MDP7084851.1 nickel pincer cofactor biosynthesis protein LarB [Dehalococcoidia bacterium]MDP7201785.1 nickel pincer cofactor biosynthesis protein LarB [Dehalococcoidia bacterium]MDP7509264.1 nickel pincer cofactor biosynthesis protein LarB [Dehalococcoidia bacterium]
MTPADASDPAVVDLGYARVDAQRSKRQGMPEAVLCLGKTPSQVAGILEVLVESEGTGIATKANRTVYRAVRTKFPEAIYHDTAKLIHVGKDLASQPAGIIVVSAGTSDIPMAEEAAITASILGHPVDRLFDVGVAGLQRLLSQTERLRQAAAVVVVAGMDGALPSVVAGLVDKPVIAVPTSNGYGASFKGLSALLSMLNSCVPGVAVVNIDNGFGAAAVAHRMTRVA